MSDHYAMRCPTCLNVTSVPKDIDVNTILTCERCARRFEFRNALADNTVAQQAGVVNAAQRDRLMLLGAPVAMASVAMISWWATVLDGPNFLGLYALFGLSAIAVATTVRWYYIDSFTVSTLAAAAYVAAGVIRYFEGSARGLENFEFMWTMLGIGLVLFFVRYEAKRGRDRVTLFGNCGGCGSSGCGSSGCGGGCGGCG